MTWTPTLYAVPPLVAAVISAGLVWYAYRNRSRPTAMPFLALMVAIGGWSAVYAVQVGFDAPRVQVFLQQVGSTFATAIPPIWVVLTLQYAERTSWLTPLRGVALAIEPMLYTLALWTNPLHREVWRRVVFHGNAPSLLDIVPGPLYWVNLAYAYLLIVVGIGLLLEVYLTGSRINRRQSVLLVAGAAVPLSANVVINFGLNPIPGLDLTTFTFTLTGIVFALALFRYDFLDLPPAAYRNISDIFGDGVLVFDREKRLLEANDHAARLLDTSLTPGRPAEDLFDVSLPDLDGTLYRAPDANQVYEARYAPLRDHQDEQVGHVVVMREVTDRHEYEQRLEVTNRVLRHNLRNEVNVILGYAEMLADSNGERPEVRRIRDAAQRLGTVSDGARHIQSLLAVDQEDLEPVDVVASVERVVDRYRDRYPAATITCETPERVPVLADDEESLALAVENVVENALEHNDRDEPTVDVSVYRDGEWSTVRVADDGPGIPQGELAPIEAERETQLEHTSSLGLWLVNWTISGVGGEVSFEENDPRGTVVMLRFQRVAE